jgi:hypothetical protein
MIDRMLITLHVVIVRALESANHAARYVCRDTSNKAKPGNRHTPVQTRMFNHGLSVSAYMSDVAVATARD